MHYEIVKYTFSGRWGGWGVLASANSLRLLTIHEALLGLPTIHETLLRISWDFPRSTRHSCEFPGTSRDPRGTPANSLGLLTPRIPPSGATTSVYTAHSAQQKMFQFVADFLAPCVGCVAGEAEE